MNIAVSHAQHMTDTIRSRFRDISFGYASAETEGAENPGLLINGFLDRFSAVSDIIKGKGLFILGSKGSGKSAVGERLRLLANERHDLFVQLRHLSAFPYKRFGDIAPGKDEAEIRYPKAWDLLFLVTLCNSLVEDQAAETTEEFVEIIKVLRENNLLADDDLRQLATVCMKKSFQLKVPIPLIGGEVSLSGDDKEDPTSKKLVDTPVFIELLERAISGYHTKSQHILVVDGLDDILISNSNQNRVLSALIQSATRLNRLFQRNGVSATIIVLCRTDIFQSIPNPNKNKIRQDYGVHLDWYHDPQNPEHSGLITLANLRCRESFSDMEDIFDECFPEDLAGQPVRKWLLEQTRHTPRDFLQLFRYIQKHVQPTDHSERISRSEIMGGTRQYSIDYFLPEIRDSLVGMLPDNQIEAGLSTLSSLRKREFTFDEFSYHSRDIVGDATYENIDIRLILEHLFNVGAIGNKAQFSNHVMYTFKYRNPNSTVNYQERFTIHKGLWKAFNLV